MGGMQTWMWGEKYPGFMDALVPMASQPTAMASRNWMLRRAMIEMIRTNPEFNDGNYTAQPRSLRFARLFFGIATSGGTLAYQKQAPNRAAADKVVDDRLAAPSREDVNDLVYQYDSSRDHDPSPGLERIQAALLAINAADDERNPPETGLMNEAMKRVKNGRLYLIPASENTRGHGTTGSAKFYTQQLLELLQSAPQRGM
jgi:homoserine O-acetyltransferase